MLSKNDQGFCFEEQEQKKEALKASALDLQSAQQTLKGSYSNILPSLMFSGSSSETIGELTFDDINNLFKFSILFEQVQGAYNALCFDNAFDVDYALLLNLSIMHHTVIL